MGLENSKELYKKAIKDFKNAEFCKLLCDYSDFEYPLAVNLGKLAKEILPDWSEGEINGAKVLEEAGKSRFIEERYGLCKEVYDIKTEKTYNYEPMSIKTLMDYSSCHFTKEAIERFLRKGLKRMKDSIE